MTVPRHKIKPVDTVEVPVSALAALASILAPLVAQQLASVAAADDEFTSLDLPRYESRRSFRQRCSGIAGAYKIGHVWHCPRAAWFASARRSAPRPIAPAAPAVTSDEELAAEMIRAAGLRATRAA